MSALVHLAMSALPLTVCGGWQERTRAPPRGGMMSLAGRWNVCLDLPSLDGKADSKIVPLILESHTGRAFAPSPKRSTSPQATSTLEWLDSLKALDPNRCSPADRCRHRNPNLVRAASALRPDIIFGINHTFASGSPCESADARTAHYAARGWHHGRKVGWHCGSPPRAGCKRPGLR
jgi:hypothetical protein